MSRCRPWKELVDRLPTVSHTLLSSHAPPTLALPHSRARHRACSTCPALPHSRATQRRSLCGAPPRSPRHVHGDDICVTCICAWLSTLPCRHLAGATQIQGCSPMPSRRLQGQLARGTCEKKKNKQSGPYDCFGLPPPEYRSRRHRAAGNQTAPDDFDSTTPSLNGHDEHHGHGCALLFRHQRDPPDAPAFGPSHPHGPSDPDRGHFSTQNSTPHSGHPAHVRDW